MSIPFRWNLARREQLGSLIDGDAAPAYSEFLDDIRVCAAKTLARSRNSDLFFIGRSPDSIFDYLSGALADTSWSTRLTLVNLSLRSYDPRAMKLDSTRSAILRDHLNAVGLAPHAIAGRGSTALVDLVDSGATFARFSEILLAWTRALELDVAPIVRNVRFVGITWSRKTSPNTFRWQQHASWLADFPKDAVKNVSVPGRLWDYLGNRQAKVAASNPPWRWGASETLLPPRWEKSLEALRLALRVYGAGTSCTERERLATELASLQEMREGWVRSLVAQLRRTSAEPGH